MSAQSDMRPLPDMQAEILDAVPALETRAIGVREALGLVLASDVAATHDLPPFPNSAMDGYAVRAADIAAVPADLPVVDQPRRRTCRASRSSPTSVPAAPGAWTPIR